MRTILYPMVIFLTSLSMIQAQNYEFRDSLEIVFLDLKEPDKSSIYELELNSILKTENYNVRNAIRSLRPSRGDVFENERLDYLRKLKRAANRNMDSDGFKHHVFRTIPELEQNFINDIKLYLIYEIIRKDTFNGRIDALPSVL